MVATIVEQAHYTEPEELLAALRGSNDDLWDGIPEAWVFRGHADAGWDLLPTVLRANSLLTHHPNRPPGPYPLAEMQIEVEARQVLTFSEVANRLGLPIPGGLSEARRRLAGPGPGTFPPLVLWELFALAQHHGVPTRFMDWSRAGLAALYFAAQQAAEMMNVGTIKPGQNLGIWALNTTTLHSSNSSGEDVHLVDPSRHGNVNIVAQDGVFTVHVYPWRVGDPPKCDPLDQTVQRIYAVSNAVGSAAMRLLTLPAKKARKLLVRLESDSVNAATIYPGYDGVVRAMREAMYHSQSAYKSPPDEF